jgi:hypothetical protein
MKAGAFLLLVTAALCSCAPTAEFEQNAPPAAAPQPLLPEAYSATPAGMVPAAPPRPVVSPAPSSSVFAVAPAWGGRSLTFPGPVLNPYHPQWTVNVQ